MSTRPNILFILSDDHAVQAISALGSRLNHTPNIDRLANEGAVFTESYCCNSICTPSRASILTGKHSHRNGVLTLQDALDPQAVTSAGLLRKVGYTTSVFGKWHLHTEPQDFDAWEVLPGQGHYYQPEYLTPAGKVTREGWVDDVTTDRMLEWLEHERDADKPFYACCHFKAPHRSWYAPERHYELFNGAIFPEPDNLFDNYANRADVLKNSKLQIAHHMHWQGDLKIEDPGPNAERLQHITPDHGEYQQPRMTHDERARFDVAYAERRASIRERRLDDEAFRRWAYQAYLTDYLRCVQGVDDNVGRLLDWLDSSGLKHNTLVIYAADQGFYLGEHGWFDKRWIFEESMRMPLLMRWPEKIKAGARYDQLVQNIDYAPTLLEAAGEPTPEDMHGTSLWRVILDDAVIHEDLYYHYYMHGACGVPAHDGVRTDRYKYVHFYRDGEVNLFDLEQDPLEMASIHDDPAYASILEQMTGRYHAARKKWDVPVAHG